MFNEKLVLKTKNKKNPYGLIHDYWNPLTTKETINFFKGLNLTNEELISLNAYIKEDKYNSFNDNAFSIYNEDGYPLNFIEGLRASVSLYEDNINHLDSLSFISSYKNEEWLCRIENFNNYNSYIGFTVTGKGSSIRAYAGNADIIWICFPNLNKGTSLSDPDDIFGTLNGFRFISSIPDGITVANAIRKLKNNF